MGVDARTIKDATGKALASDGNAWKQPLEKAIGTKKQVNSGFPSRVKPSGEPFQIIDAPVFLPITPFEFAVVDMLAD
jgi:hypothetical protein